MCGILVWISNKNDVDSDKLTASLRLQNHRGPDTQNILLCNGPDTVYQSNINRIDKDLRSERFRIGFGHNRLSIIDLSNISDQPMFSEDKRYAIIFNGAIYNYIELRQRLESQGERFRTKSDTEVLLKALIKWGADCTKELNGMWAFAFFDIKSQKIILSRDRFGKKPLFYYSDENIFIAASEYKTIFRILGDPPRKINLDYLGAYIFFNHWPTFDNGRSFYENIFSLNAGCSLIFDIKDDSIKIIRNNLIKNFLNKDCNPEDLTADLRSAVKIRLRADVPIGILVSGGIDSAIVSAYASINSPNKEQITWYTARLESSEDLQYARLVGKSLNIKLKEIDIPYDINAVEIIKKMVYYYEIPLIFGGISISAYSIYNAIAKDGIKVVLDGTGGDEIFAGYLKLYRRNFVYSLIYKGRLKEAVDFCHNQDENFRLYMEIWVRSIVRSFLRKFFDFRAPRIFDLDSFANNPYTFARYIRDQKKISLLCNMDNSRFGADEYRSLFNTQLYDLTKGALPVWLYMIDQNSMMHSIESRSPLLDYRLIKYLNLPEDSKIKEEFAKYSLRKAMPSIMDSTVTWRKRKEGFPWDKKNFINNNLREITNKIGDSRILNDIFDIDGVIKDWQARRLKCDYFLDDFILRFYSVALLEHIHNCKI